MLDVAQVHDLLQGGSGIASAQEAAEGAAKGDTSDERADEESPVDAKAKRTTAMEAAFMFGRPTSSLGVSRPSPPRRLHTLAMSSSSCLSASQRCESLAMSIRSARMGHKSSC